MKNKDPSVLFFIEESTDLKKKGFSMAMLMRAIDPFFEGCYATASLKGRKMKGVLIRVEKEKQKEKLLRLSNIRRDYHCFLIENDEALDLSSLKTCPFYQQSETSKEKETFTVTGETEVGHILFEILVVCRKYHPELKEIFEGSFISETKV